MLKKNQFFVMMLIILGILCAADYTLFASITSTTSKDEVQLPVQTLNYSKSLLYSNIGPNKFAKYFIEQYPDWTVQLNKSTGSIHRAFGKPIKINGFDVIDNVNIKTAAERFINDNKKNLGIDFNDLYLKRSKLIGGKWYVSFGQKYQGLDVLLSEIELRINQKGYVFAFGADYFNDITISTKPALNLKQVESKAFPNTMNMKSGDKIQSAGQIFVLPVKSKGKVNYKLVYKFVESYQNPVGGYVTYIDANAGEIIWKQSTIFNAKTKIIVEGEIKVNNPTETPSINPLGQINILIGGESYLADENGEVDVNLTTDKIISAKLTGPYCNIDIADQAMEDNNFIDTISPGEDFTMIWDDNNSHRYERNVFYYTNSVHDYIKSIDPDFNGMDYPMTVNLEFEASSPNAYWDGESITFLSLSSSDTRMADGPAVLYHEYGHGINQKLYESQGVAEGMINASCNEGMADVNSSMILDIPEMGLGVFVNDPNEIIRTLDNKLIFPDSVDGESHHDGQILGGAFWDLRKLTSLETAGRIAHFAKYGIPDDPNVGIAFGEWFLETLIADDDDGDLSNKTPHFDQIVEAFNNHNIGTGLYIVSSFTHTPINDTQITDEPYVADFSMSGLPVQGYQPTKVKLKYSINNFEKLESVDAIPFNSNYEASIPAQPKGTIVQYYFEVTDPITGQTHQRYQDIMNKKPFVFIVAFNLSFSENFETATGKNWKIGTATDDATTGKWEIAKPNAIDYTPFGMDFVIQPGEDHTETGAKCLVTGAGGTLQDYNKFMPNGKTTFFSPVFDLTLIEKPLIRFHTWQFSYSYIAIPGYEPTFTVSVSSDGGSNWAEALKMNVATDGWEKAQFLLEDYIDKTSTNQLMVSVDVPHQGAQAFALYECLFDDFELLSVNQGSVSAEDNQVSDNSISIYPNPFFESLKIQNGSSININQLEISDLIGTIILSKKIDLARKVIELEGIGNIPSGTYFVKMYTDTGVLVRKVIK